MYDAAKVALDKISIHALVKRATRFLVTSARPFLYFNPRPREEGDIFRLASVNRLYISIHALVKRATRELALRGQLPARFQSTPS